VEKGGLASALAAAGLSADSGVGWADEMRVGLRGQVRRVWGRRGVPVRQRLQLTYEWRYLFVVVDGRAGRVWWEWLPRVSAEALAPLVGGLGLGRTELAGLVWDRAPAHRDGRMRAFGQAIGLALIEQPPYAPELNPAERLIEEIRRVVEGPVYPTLDAKVAAVDAFLAELDADPARLRRLAGWDWIAQAFHQLPASSLPIAA
jgi:DDE superfamily endonuclease